MGIEGDKKMNLVKHPDTFLRLPNEEVELPTNLAAQELSLKGLDLGARFGLIAVAVRHASDQALHFRPRAETPLRPGDNLLVMGKKKGLDSFQKVLSNQPLSLFFK